MTGGQVVFLALVGAWLVLAVMGMLIGMRRREHAHRERLAMIERGLMPPPEMATDDYEPHRTVWRERRAPLSAIMARKLGVLILFGAAGISWLIFLVDDERIAMGVGGLLGMIGLAFIVISFNLGQTRDERDR